MVLSLTPLLLAIVLLTALLPQLQTLKLAGLEAQTREKPDVPLPTSPSVALPCVTVFAAARTRELPRRHRRQRPRWDLQHGEQAV